MNNVEMILIATGHKEIINLDWNKMKNLCKSRIIFDGRRVLDKTIMENNGWTYTGIGVPLV
jgi:UDP-glucose 6-dehydrogenase